MTHPFGEPILRGGAGSVDGLSAPACPVCEGAEHDLIAVARADGERAGYERARREIADAFLAAVEGHLEVMRTAQASLEALTRFVSCSGCKKPVGEDFGCACREPAVPRVQETHEQRPSPSNSVQTGTGWPEYDRG